MAYEFDTNLDLKFTKAQTEAFSEDDEERLAKKKAWEEENYWTLKNNPLPMPADYFPICLRLTSGKEMFDFQSVRPLSQWLVSPAFKDLVEEFDPGLHQFLPVKIFHKNGKFYRDLFFMRIEVFIDSINPVLGGVRKTFYTQDPIKYPDDFGWEVNHKSDDKLAMFKDIVQSRGIWRDKHKYVYCYMSDAFYERARELNLEGFDVQRHWKEL
jgi:hypothetical protein